MPDTVGQGTTPGAGGGAPAAAERVRVLVIDDEPFVGRALSRALARHAVTLVDSGEQALAALEKGPFDVIFCDLMMPHMTGMDLHDAVRARWPGREARFVFITGGVFTPRAQDFLASVPNRCAEKPFSPSGLLTIVSEVYAQLGPAEPAA